jgi:hypothetical protein
MAVPVQSGKCDIKKERGKNEKTHYLFVWGCSVTPSGLYNPCGLFGMGLASGGKEQGGVGENFATL